MVLGAGSFSDGKRRAVRHASFGHPVAHRQARDRLGRDAFVSLGWNIPPGYRHGTGRTSGSANPVLQRRRGRYNGQRPGRRRDSVAMALGKPACRTGPRIVRFSEGKIKEAILHPDIETRDRAVGYFAKSNSHDRSIMPMVVRAVETYGRQDAYRLIGSARDLPQTEESIAWVISELNDEQCPKYENYSFNLSMLLGEADPTLLLQNESAILDARHFLAYARAPIIERLQMLSWDEATCWRELETFCEEGKDKQYVNEVNLGYAERIVEALARYGGKSEEKVHAILTQKIEDYHHHPMRWMEPLAVRLAGEAGLESAIHLIIGKLLEDGGDLLNAECARALTRISTPAVLEAVAEVYPTTPRSFRLFATGPLEYIRSDLAVEKCLHVLRQEKDEMIQQQLAYALLSQFAEEGIEQARRLLVGRRLDYEGQGLRRYLLETCTIMGKRFPEYEEWQAAEKAETEEHWKRIKECEGDPAAMLAYTIEKLSGKKTPAASKAAPPARPVPRSILPPRPASRQKVGRNDPCPCGSGKKFKNCCIKKRSGP